MIRVEILNGEKTVDRLRSFPERLNARLGRVMQTLGLALQASARDKIGGKLGEAIDVDTGSSAGDISVSVGVGDVPYAAFQEYGFNGTETVRAHLRTIKQAFGRAIAPREIAVRSYTRRVDYPAHSYLRAALGDIDAVAEIDSAVAAQVSE